MITGPIKSQIDQIWNAFWSGGISNPIEVIEQITYLLFLRRLDDLHTLEENKSARVKGHLARRVFPEGKDGIGKKGGRSYDDLRWSRFKHFASAEMYTVVSEHVFPFLRTLGGLDSTYAHHMKDARFTIPRPGLLFTLTPRSRTELRVESRQPSETVRRRGLALIYSLARAHCSVISRAVHVNQTIRFCTAPDGVRIAYATLGEGPPLVKTANWLSHLEFDLESPVWRHWLRELSRDHQLLRYDERGCGLSDWDAAENSLDAWVRDLESVVDAAGLERFPLLGISQGGPVAIAYAVRHPERVTQLILYGSYARGWMKRNTSPAELAQREAMITLTRHGWGGEVPAFREPFTLSFIPDATYEQRQWFDELQRITCSPENAVRLQYATGDVDVADLLPRVTAPTLVLHARGDMRCPFDEGRTLAAGIPTSRFVSLDGRNHVLLEDEPAWPTFLREVRSFLGVNPAPSPGLPTTAPDALLLPGTRLGRYEVDVRLGEGGMGTVYRARDTRLDRVVALKLIAGLADEGARARLGQEARAAAALNHPNICTLHELEEVGDRVFLVMEYVDGTPLSERGAEALSPETVRELGRQIADALAHAHDRGVVHRDLKCANVMVTAGGRVKVLDFGIAGRISTAATMTSTGVTGGAGITGTPAYMAPEALRGSLSDPRSDLWSLGVVLYELLAGGRPFAGDTTFDLSSAILRDAPPPLAAHVPADLGAVVMRCLEKDPASRYPDASEVAAALL